MSTLQGNGRFVTDGLVFPWMIIIQNVIVVSCIIVMNAEEVRNSYQIIKSRYNI